MKTQRKNQESSAKISGMFWESDKKKCQESMAGGGRIIEKAWKVNKKKYLKTNRKLSGKHCFGLGKHRKTNGKYSESTPKVLGNYLESIEK